MIGLTVLVVIALYIGASVWVISALKSRWAKATVALVALAIPLWDWPVGYYSFRQHCMQDGGLHVGSTLPASSAVLVDPSVGYTPDELLRLGFKTVEYGTTRKFDRHSNGSYRSIQSNQSVPISTVKIHVNRNQRLAWNVFRNDIIVARVDTAQVLARQTGFTWLGTWWQARAAPLFGYGPACFPENADVLRLVVRGTS